MRDAQHVFIDHANVLLKHPKRLGRVMSVFACSAGFVHCVSRMRMLIQAIPIFCDLAPYIVCATLGVELCSMVDGMTLPQAQALLNMQTLFMTG